MYHLFKTKNLIFTVRTKYTIMKEIKFSLLMAIVVMSTVVAQQTTSFSTEKGDLASNVSGKTKNNSLDSSKWQNSKASEQLPVAEMATIEELSGISIYPYPARDLVTLLGVKEQDEIIITDANGNSILEIKAKASVEIIPIDFLETGMYKIAINGVEKSLPVE